MKKVLIAVEFVGRPETEASDKKIVEFVRAYSDFNEIHLYCSDLVLNETGEYIRMKQLKVFHDFAQVSSEEYDKILAVDPWAKKQVSMMNHGEPRRQEKSEPMELETEKEEKPIKKARIKDASVKYDASTKKIADIIIPHHDRHDHLETLLEMIPNDIFNITMVSGRSFGKNCNKGAKTAETKKLIFLNDDIEINADQLVKIANCLNKYDIVGSTQLAGDDQKKYYGIGFYRDGDKIRHRITMTESESIFPSGFCFGITKKAWDSLKGFNDKYNTGNEDIDFGLRAMDKKLKMHTLDLEIPHKESQSQDRFKFVEENEELFYQTWGDKLEKYENTNNLSDDELSVR